MNGLTAMLGLELLGLADGETLLVTGGAGAAGLVCDRHRQAPRACACSPTPSAEDEELVRGFGADMVSRAAPGLPTRPARSRPTESRRVYDTALLGRDVFGAIRDGGAIAVVRGWDGSPDRARDRGAPGARPRGARADRLAGELRALASDGTLALRVAGEYPPERAADAQQAMDAGGLRGRALIVF